MPQSQGNTSTLLKLKSGSTEPLTKQLFVRKRTTKTVKLYIAFIVDVKKFAFSSIRSYVNIISVLHKIHDAPDPIASCWNIRHLLTGVKCEVKTVKHL
jgi:hypothetical protein